ncbi:MAG: cytochrome c biogenesis protein CcdA [Chloroflexi bacterium]|nr:cytochrome c biogenesis protein CcdA [Chloroflexota bacterium]
MGIETVVAFAGGVLSLLSPCSALLLPAFFAYAFPSRGQLLLRTAVFYVGLLTLFVPLGLGVGALGSLFLEHRTEVSIVAGLLLIAIGAFQLAVGGFEVPGAGRLSGRGFAASGESLAATYVLGLVYGIGGFCSGPLLGGVLTIAGASGGAIEGAVLLAIFAAGMAAPLFALALAWDRLGASGRGRLRGRELQLGPIRRHSSVVISSLLFIGLGAAFIVFQGSNALGGLYAALGAADLALSIESGVRDLAVRTPLLLVAIVGLPMVALVAIAGRSLTRRKRRVPEPGE